MMKVNILETDTGRILEDELRDWSQAALNQLDKAYGYKSFRPGQLEAVNTILNDRDLVAVMPTGSGKSVCYQLPAMREGHLALVVSPLRALMRDQVQALQARGVAAALIDSGVTPKQRQSIYAMAHGGGLRILYVAPERLFADYFLFFSQSTRIDLIAVDEAHCVLQWGHDFRPNYLKIGEFIAGLPTRPVVAAFDRLHAMSRYCETDQCLRGAILDYFGDTDHEEYCDNCGNCTYVQDCDPAIQASHSTKKKNGKGKIRDTEVIDTTIVRFVYARERLLGFGYGIRKTIRSLVGDTGEGVDDRGIGELEGYGALENVDEDVIEARIHTLIDDGTIYVGQYHTLLEP